MTRNYHKQHIIYENGYAVDCGTVAFSTTDAEVEIDTCLSRIHYVKFQAARASSDTDPIAGANEHLWLDEALDATFGGVIVSGSTVSLRRAAEPFLLAGVASTDYITGNDYVEVPIGVSPVAGTLNQAWYYNDVQNGDDTPTPHIDIGHVPASGTGSTDVNRFLSDAQAVNVPADSTGLTITTFATTAVDALDLITFGTTGADANDPQGGWCQVKITPTLTSGLVVFYKLIGID